MERIRSIVWIAAFLIIIASPRFTYFFLGQYVDSVNYENRNAEEKPILLTNNYETFPESYELYFNDNIPYRNQLIRFNNSIDYFIFKQSSSEKVAVGLDNWLFYCSKTDRNPIEQSLGYWTFTDEQLEKITANLVYTQQLLKRQNIEFVLFIAPNKETIYSEYLPDYYSVQSEMTSTDQLIAYLKEHTDIRVVYPKKELLDFKSNTPEVLLYQKLDTHWNKAGAYIGAISLAKELGIAMPTLNEIDLKEKVSSSGDLAKMLNINIQNANTDYTLSGISNLKTEYETWDMSTEYIGHTAGADKRRLFVRRDSFSTAMAPSLATQFENSMFVHTNYFEQQQIFDFNADIFVYETAERYIASLSSFRISYVSYTVEELDDTKNISIGPAINGLEPLYATITQKGNTSDIAENIQQLQPLTNITLSVPKEQTGEICVYVYDKDTSENIIEEILIKY